MKVSLLNEEFRKAYGETVGGIGEEMSPVERVPSGVFEFDLAFGGGVPRGAVTEIFGPEGCGKTTLALKLMAQHQRLWPGLTCAYFDLENALDFDWARNAGVDVEAVGFWRPDYSEQFVDMLQLYLSAEDCGLVVVDSLAAIMTAGQVDKPADAQRIGSASQLIALMCKKVTKELEKQRKEGHVPTVIYINQTRYKLNVKFGDPETTPGGNAPRFQAALRIRLWGKDLYDKKVHSVMPYAKKVDAIARKWKVPVVARHAKWDMALVNHAGLAVGECDPWPRLREYAQDFDILTKEGKGWNLLGAHYGKLADARQALMDDPELMAKVREMVAEKFVEKAGDLKIDAVGK